MNRTKKTRAEREWSRHMKRMSNAMMSIVTFSPDMFIHPETVATPTGQQHVTALVQSLQRIIANEPPTPCCLTCGAEVPSVSAVAYVVTVVARNAHTSGIDAAICKTCAARYGSIDAAETAGIEVLRVNVWPDLRTLDRANIPDVAGRA